jgi:transmembrane sensor
MEVKEHDRALLEAARWCARLQASDCTEQERAEFERWRALSVVHASAYARAQQVSAGVDRLLTDARLQALADLAFDASATRTGRQKLSSRWTVPAAMAAGLALAALGVHMSVRLMQPTATMIAYDTARDERRSVHLEDGSVVQMDIGTRLEVRMSAHRREVDLIAGRAMFEVAHDKGRPFSVLAAGARTTALGTQFQVERDQDRVVVTLAEGSVAVDGVQNQSEWREQLWPGEQLSFETATAAIDKRSVDLQRTTSWMRGRHVFRSTPLSEALDEVNRYATKKVRLGDPSLADLPVGGSFIAGDSELIVDALVAVLPISAVADSGNEILLFRRYE